VLFENPPKNIESLIAKSADLTNKPFVHSVVKINGEYEFEEEDIDLTVNILCRDKEGKRLEIYDLELELLKSNNELARLIFPYLPKLQAIRPSRFDWSDEIDPSPLIIPSILSN